MLSPVETDLVRRDPAIPGLALVLDPEALVEALRGAVPQADPRTARIQYVKYRHQKYCQVHYRLDLNGRDVDMGAWACRADNLAERTRNLNGSVTPGPFEQGPVVLKKSAVIVTAFPADLKLAGLLCLRDAEERRHLFSELFPDQPDLWQADLRCLRYRPGRRYVAELFTEDGKRALVKAYRRKAYVRGKHNATAFRSEGSLRLARLLGCSDRHSLLAFEWLPGRPLTDLVTAGEADDKMVAAAGEALAAVHSQNVEGLPERPRELEAKFLVSVGMEVGSIFPTLAHRAMEMAWRLGVQLTQAPTLRFPLHHDFNGNQVLVCGRDVAVVDFDQACLGDPADDLGNLIAQAERDALGGNLAAAQVDWLRDALIEGYCRATHRPPPLRIALYTAAQLFQRTLYPFRNREPECLERTESLLGRAEEILATMQPQAEAAAQRRAL